MEKKNNTDVTEIKEENNDLPEENNHSYNEVFIKQENVAGYLLDETGVDEDNTVETELEEIAGSDSKKKYFCTFKDCQAHFLRPSRLLRHLRQHTGERPYKCKFNDCDKAYTNSSHLKRHLETHSNTKQIFTCPHCPKKISFLHNLKRHCARMHSDNDERMVCKDCGKRFRKLHSFQEHLADHANSSVTYKCLHCDLSFTNHAKLKRHNKSHDKAGLKCKICEIKFEHREDYNNHLKSVHATEHVCNVCNKSFIRKSFLEKHRSTHTNENMFTCHYENCYRMYYFKRNLDNHIRTSHLGRKFTCDMCSVQYTSKRRLQLHISKVHQGTDLEPKKEQKPKSPKKRKNKGVPTKSMVSRLIGVEFPHDVEKTILNRTSLITILKTEPDF